MHNNRTILWSLFTVVLCVFILSGCATIFKGSDHQLRINSTPAAAKVVVKATNNIVFFEGTTPASTKVPKKNEYIVTISLSGYKDATVNVLKDGIEGWFWGNLLCGGVVGIVVDLVTGAINKLSPDEISVSLVTAYNQKTQNQELYAALQAYDQEGNLRHLLVPLQRQ